MPTDRQTQMEALSRPDGGIHCANEDCVTKSFERRPGNMYCSFLLCKRCCQARRRNSSETVTGSKRAVCAEKRHRIPLISATGSTNPTPGVPSKREQSIVKVEDTPLATEKTTVAIQQPLGDSFPEMEESICVRVIAWIAQGRGPIEVRVDVNVKKCDKFQLQNFPVLLDLLSLEGGKQVEAYDPHEGSWFCHGIKFIRKVETQTPLLYRVLPAGVTGVRLAECDCPGLKQEIERKRNLGQASRELTAASGDVTASSNKRRPERDADSEDDVRPTKRPSRKASAGSPARSVSPIYVSDTDGSPQSTPAPRRHRASAWKPFSVSTSGASSSRVTLEVLKRKAPMSRPTQK